MHCFHFVPLVVLVRSRSSHTMSEATVLDEPESDSSKAIESMHTEEHGEFGATWRAETIYGSATASSRRTARTAMVVLFCVLLDIRKGWIRCLLGPGISSV